jgi:hypothetical protein
MEELEAPDLVDIALYAERGERTPHGQRYRVRVDGDNYEIDTARPSEAALLALVNKRECAFELIEELRDRENYVVEPGETIDLHKPGLKGFITAHRAIVTIKLENIDYFIERGPHTVAQILALAGKTPDAYDLLEEIDGPPMPVPENRIVEIQGCEVFYYQVKSGGSS